MTIPSARTNPDSKDAADMAAPLPPDYPPVLYVPCSRPAIDPDDLEVEYHTTRDGRLALLVYTALDRLHACRGADQPWFLMATAQLDELHRHRPFDLVLLDVVLPAHLQRPPVGVS